MRTTSPNSEEELLFRLLRADSENEVVQALSENGLWDNDSAWRYYGDEPGNFSTAGSQQRNPEAALVEKIINSVDACLMERCLVAGIDPRSVAAPKEVREAVAAFFEGATLDTVRDYQGLLSEWTPEKRTEVARNITVALTGPRAEEGGRPSITIADQGEGQSPEQIPDTILSLNKGIKNAIHFVQGKFNMGGTGALRFCGDHNLQLVLSKRHPQLARHEAVSQDWGFTIVRRETPGRVSTYRYLAPQGCQDTPRRGDVLTVARNELPIFPDGQTPYTKPASWGTLIKLYEYGTRYRTHFFRRSGLQERLDLLMPGIALPVRLHECRSYAGGAGSFETTLSGLGVRLTGSRSLEDGFPDTGQLEVSGERMGVTIYAFKRGVARTYRGSEGVLFVVNGQTHAVLQDRFFRHTHELASEVVEIGSGHEGAYPSR